MRSKSDEYRRTAVDCLRVAEQITDPAAKAELILMARSRIALADQADRNSQTDLVYETPPPEHSQRWPSSSSKPNQEPEDKK